ncbi:MAG: hypothetical protein AAGH15_27055, partial [Myxococcota bacterium]
PPAPVPEPLAAELTAQNRALLQRVAFGDDVAHDAEDLLARAQPHLPAIGRRPDLAEPLGNVCLYAVRAHVQAGRRVLAERTALRCLQLVPDLTPDPDVHPPRVRRRLARARAERERVGERLVVTTPEDDPGECAVRVQGRRMGATPRVEVLLAPGPAFVQVECDPEPGRVHALELEGGGRSEREVPVGLEQALGGAGPLSLGYATAARRDARRGDHGARLVRALQLDAVVLAWRTGDAAHLARVDAQGATVDARFPAGDAVALGAALDALAEGRSVDLGPASPRPPRAEPLQAAAPSPAVYRRTPAYLGFGYGFVLLGIGGLAGGWGTYVRWRETNDALDGIDDAEFDRRFQREDRSLVSQLEDRDAQRVQALALGGGGAGFLSLAMPLLLPEREGVPWGAWVAGIAGAGALGAGLWLRRDHETPDAEGLRFQQAQPLAGLVAMHGAPLLTIPLVYALRWAAGRARRDRASARLTPLPGGARLELGLAL